MFDSKDYNEAVADLLAATIRKVEARQILSAACDAQTDDLLEGALVQQKRLAVYSADNDWDEAAERFHRQWSRVKVTEAVR